MWFESQNCAMMGLQATTGKRKLEAATAPGDPSPAKAARWEMEDCIARLQAVAVPSDPWRPPPSATTTTTVATLLHHHHHHHHHQQQQQQHHQQHHQHQPQQQPQPQQRRHPEDFVDDDDDFDDELSDDSTSTATPSTPSYHYYHQYYQPQVRDPGNPAGSQPQPQTQTIRRDENGKSYLELGAASPTRIPTVPSLGRCCDGRTRWCHVPCYRQRRLAVLNLSMCKLARFRQCTDPSLRRSVLICNTLRRIEREMEAEPPEPCYQGLPEMTPPSRLCPVPEVNLYEQSLREMTAQSGRATPFPQAAAPDTDSGIGDDEATRPINWSSVLSLTSQTDLESLNNNELYAELGIGTDGSLSQDWTTTSNPMAPSPMTGPPPRPDHEWDGFIQVLVGGS